MRRVVLCGLLLGAVIFSQAKALTRWESPATWQIYQQLISYKFLHRVKPECIDLTARHSYRASELAYDLVLGKDKMCSIYGNAGDKLAVARLNPKNFEVMIDDVIPRLLKPGLIHSDQTFYPGRDAYQHPTLGAFRAYGFKINRVDLTQNRVYRVYYANLPEGVRVTDQEPMSKVMDHICRSNGGWNFDLLDQNSGDLISVRCHPSGVVWVSSLDMVYTGDPARVEGTDDWDQRTEH